MNKITFIIVGSGWRACFYARIAKAYPEYFDLKAMYCRSIEKAEKIALELGIHTTVSIEECIGYHPDFAVVAVNKTSIFEVSTDWLERGIPVLCETPPSLKLEELNELWRLYENGAKIAVAEQYFKYPCYDAMLKILNEDIIGEPYNVTVNAMHDYHAVSMIRKILRTGFDNVTLRGKKYNFPVTETLTRYEKIFDGRVADKERDRIDFQFSNGKTAFYDFSSVQYRSTIRERHINIQSVRGEYTDGIVKFLNNENNPMVMDLSKCLEYNNNIIFGDRGLNEDEQAIAVIMAGMKEYVTYGSELYPLAEALHDAYLTILMQKALMCPYEEIKMERQAWMNEQL